MQFIIKPTLHCCFTPRNFNFSFFNLRYFHIVLILIFTLALHYIILAAFWILNIFSLQRRYPYTFHLPPKVNTSHLLEMYCEQQDLLKIMSLLLAIVLIIPNGIEESLSPHSLAPDIAFKKQMNWVQSRMKTRVQPLHTCFAKKQRSEGQPT